MAFNRVRVREVVAGGWQRKPFGAATERGFVALEEQRFCDLLSERYLGRRDARSVKGPVYGHVRAPCVEGGKTKRFACCAMNMDREARYIQFGITAQADTPTPHPQAIG